MKELQPAPYADAAYIDATNKKLGVAVEEFIRLDGRQRQHIIHRVSEWHLVDAETLNAEAARHMFTEARQVCARLISDHLARTPRPWWRRLLGLR